MKWVKVFHLLILSSIHFGPLNAIKLITTKLHSYLQRYEKCFFQCCTTKSTKCQINQKGSTIRTYIKHLINSKQKLRRVWKIIFDYSPLLNRRQTFNKLFCLPLVKSAKTHEASQCDKSFLPSLSNSQQDTILRGSFFFLYTYLYVGAYITIIVLLNVFIKKTNKL